MKHQFNDKDETLVKDSWSNTNNCPVIAACLNVDGKAYFVDATDTGSNSKTASNCKNLCQESIISAKSKFGCGFKSVCTDNAKNMEKNV